MAVEGEMSKKRTCPENGSQIIEENEEDQGDLSLEELEQRRIQKKVEKLRALQKQNQIKQSKMMQISENERGFSNMSTNSQNSSGGGVNSTSMMPPEQFRYMSAYH